MKVKLKMFPNGARVVYEATEYIKQSSMLKDHFCLVCKEKNLCLYLHRDTYVEPIITETKL